MWSAASIQGVRVSLGGEQDARSMGPLGLNGMSTVSTRPTPQNGESFSKYFDQWLEQQQHDLQALLAAVSNHRPLTAEEENNQILPLINRVVSNYENYYMHKSNFAKRDVKPMFSPSWTSTTENMFLWVGGWRPSMAFHLLYSKSGIQLESQLDQIINGTPTYDLSDISSSQLQQIDRLQRETIEQEREISEEEAKVQETGADKQMVELVNVITEIGGNGGEDQGAEMLKPQIENREEKMEQVLQKADQLRLDTLKGIIGILTPLQASNFLIAAAELHLRIHEYGKSKDGQPAHAG